MDRGGASAGIAGGRQDGERSGKAFGAEATVARGKAYGGRWLDGAVLSRLRQRIGRGDGN